MIEDITSFNFNTTPRIIYGANVAKDASPFSKPGPFFKPGDFFKLCKCHFSALSKAKYTDS